MLQHVPGSRGDEGRKLHNKLDILLLHSPISDNISLDLINF